jgi:hypothetical protein
MVLSAMSLLMILTGLTEAAVDPPSVMLMPVVLPMIPSFSIDGVSAPAPEVVTATPVPASTM